ncbi:tail spike protein [Klebsiella phage vB_Ko_K66PH128C1]|uniref:Tail spike protein n=1 Tax=Klebsiella phage vB_Ko_K66PH128C1 TaxID=3071610 RepID=A0AAD2GQB9_9CAUD|nr:tail spike protein [Klebsiella phage vB_Ko_K66PH128C1]
MAFSWQESVKPAGTQDIQCDIEYLDKSYIHVYLDGAETTAFTWTSSTNIRLNSPLSAETAVLLIRKTERKYLYIEFASGAPFIEGNVDTQNMQLLHLAQELVEGRYIEGFYGDINMHRYRITNLGDPVDVRDATNKQYVDTEDARRDARIDAEAATRKAADDALDARVINLEQTYFNASTNSFSWWTVTTAPTSTITPGMLFTKAKVRLNGITQTAGYSYSVANGVITFAETVPAGTLVDVTIGIDTEADTSAVSTVLDLLASPQTNGVGVNVVHLTGAATVPFERFLADSGWNMDAAILAAAASGKTVLFRNDETYTISVNDIPFARYTSFIGNPGGNPPLFLITNPTGTYGTFNLYVSNGLNGGRYNKFDNLSFRYPNQVKTGSAIPYPPLFAGGCYGSEFTNLDIGNAYIGFRLGGTLNSVELGTASRVRLSDIIGAPLYRGLSLEQVRDVPTIQNIRWNYNYLDGGPYAYDSTLKQWMHDNAWAFQFGRLDWSLVSNLSAYGYLRGVVLLSTRYTGSADRLRFVGCTFDHTVNPVYLQNFSNSVDFIGCGFTGDRGSEFTRITPSNLYINNVGDTSAWVNFIDCTINNLTSDGIRTGSNLRLSGGTRLWGLGYDGTVETPRNGVYVTANNVSVDISASTIDVSAGQHTRCVFDGGMSGCMLTVSAGAKLIGASLEVFRWNGSTSNREVLSDDVYVPGTVTARGFLSFYSPRQVYRSASVPTVGTFARGERVLNMSPTVLGAAGSQYVVEGWLRLTSGDTHTMGVDWLELKQLTGS